MKEKNKLKEIFYHYNRYNDKLTIERIDINTFEISGFAPYYRYAEDENNKIYMVDPSGGPYIRIDEDGFDMSEFDIKLKGIIINEIKLEENKIILKRNEQ